MPALLVKSSCCTSRAPPSPDAVPARPAIPAMRSDDRVSKHHIPSWLTADTAELRAIFEENESADPCRAKHISHKDSAKFKDLFQEDKFVTDSESERVTTKKSSSTLKTVTQKLKKHLSKDEGLSKRHSRNSVGTSEEEIERRAELRRIRERRIREELSNEGIYDDDAKSVASPSGTPVKNDRGPAWVPGEYVPMPALSPLSLSLPTLDPLEAAHKLLLESSSSSGKTPKRQTHSTTPSTTVVNTTASVSRRHSSPILSEWDPDRNPDEPLVYIPSRKGSSIPQMPPAPIILAQRLPSLTDPVTSPWRLSFSTDNRGQHLRKLSQGHAVSATIDTQLLRPASPPSIQWLHSQGLRSPSRSHGVSKEFDNHESSTSNDITQANQDFGGVDGVKDASAAAHLQDMQISRRLASKGLHSSASSPQLSSWGSHQRGVSNISSASRNISNERARYLCDTSDSAPLSERIPQSWGAVVDRRASSIYPSAPNSMPHSRESSALEILSVFPGSRGRKCQVAMEKEAEAEDFQSLYSLTKSPTANLSSASLAAPLTRYTRTSPDDSSLIASETESFREREAELSIVETRFATSDFIRSRTAPVSSKFIEEFNVDSDVGGRPPRKLSVFNRLAKFAVKSYDGSSKIEDILDVPIPSFSTEALRTSKSPGGALQTPGGSTTLMSPLAELDDSAQLWGRAIKKEGSAEPVEDEAQLAGRQKSVVHETNDNGDEVPKSAFGTFIGLRKGLKKNSDINNHRSAAEEYNDRFQKRMAVKELVMDSWEEEMAATAAKAKAKSRTIIKKSKKPTMPDKRYPFTWSRYDSETRNERSISAAAGEQIYVQDFAVLGRKEDGEIIWCLQHDDDGHHAEIAESRKGFRHKIGDRVRHKAYKFETSDEQSQQTRGRRGSLTVAGELEYPELEVLPFALRTEEQIEADINAEKEAEKVEMEKEKPAEKHHVPKLAFRRKANDGTLDMDETTLNVSGISIADPRFYDDCVVHPNSEVTREEVLRRSQTLRVTSAEKRNKYRTWSVKDWEGYMDTSGGLGSSRRNRYSSMGTLVLRKSTDDYFMDVENMERKERERVLSVAEVAWGGGQ